jgi:predicted nucleic acid-binding protein
MSNSPICVDASLVARLFVGPDDAQVWALFDRWAEQEVLVCAPTLLVYELTNVFHKYQQRGYLSASTARLVQEAALELPIFLEPHATLAAAALRISTSLRLSAAYDAYYLALAQQFGADLWTADVRLKRRAGPFQDCVRIVGEAGS